MSIRYIKILAAVLTILTAVLVGLGGYVRATGAGLACPDWPLCFGRLVPEDFGFGVAQEVIHRYIAGVVGILTLVLAYALYAGRSSFPRLASLARMLLILLAVQVILGGLTVWLTLNPFIVTSHLLFGTLFLQAMAMLATDTPEFKASDAAKHNSPPGAWIAAFFLLVLLQTVLGGFVGSSGASLACPGLFYCTDKLIPDDAGGPQVVQMLHRGVGVLILFAAVALFSVQRKSKLKSVRWIVAALPTIVAVQIGMGILNVHLLIPPHVTVTHLMLAQVLLLLAAMLWRQNNPALRLFAGKGA